MKKTILWIILDLIFLIVFNAVFFLVGGYEHEISVWISYIFIHFSYLMILATPILVRNSSSSKLLGLSLCSVSVAYFFVEFIVGTLFILIGSETYKFTLLTQIIIAAVYAVCLLANMIANEHTIDNEKRHESEIEFIKKNASKLDLLIEKVSDKKANKKLEKIYDLLDSSPSKSNDRVKNIEAEIEIRISDMEKMISLKDYSRFDDICEKITELINQRNSILKTTN